jgi:hypothetical protein
MYTKQLCLIGAIVESWVHGAPLAKQLFAAGLLSLLQLVNLGLAGMHTPGQLLLHRAVVDAVCIISK